MNSSGTSTLSLGSDVFLDSLGKDYGVKKRKTWHNNNHTLEQEGALILNMKDLSKDPSDIIKRIYNYNLENQEAPIVAAPVAGWKEKVSVLERLNIFSKEARDEVLLKEYAQSFSLSAISTAKNASVVLRTSKDAQYIKTFERDGQHYVTVTPGVRITDADRVLLEEYGLSLPPHMPTLHVASLVGAAANGCYGPARDYGSMTTAIVEMKIINALGEELTLSATEHEDLFTVLRDCHLGTCFVTEITFKAEPKFVMKRSNVLLQDTVAFKEAMLEENQLDKEHFIMMYIPVDIEKQGEHSPRIRLTTFERTDLKEPPEETKTQEQKDFCDYLNLNLTELGEPLIDFITSSEKLRKFFPFLLKAAANKTYGTEKETTEIDWSAKIAHIFGTYTDLPIADINWLIQVENGEEARKILIELIELVENKLKKDASNKDFPILNAFARYLKGICYPEGKGGIAPTGVDAPNQSILSFELVTYAPLAETEAFKSLRDEVINHLKAKGLKFSYHPGKTMPENTSLKQMYADDEIRKKRLKNFKKAVYELHGGKENIPFSTLLTPQKKEFIGLNSGKVEKKKIEEREVKVLEKEHIHKALNAIIDLAKEDEEANAAVIRKASKYLLHSR